MLYLSDRHMKIGVYIDSGSSFTTVVRAITQEVDSAYIVQAIIAGHLDRDNFFDDLDVFVMPGGADLPYCAKLNGSRNKRLRNWVEQGGIYLGLCAGAYYGCSRIIFNGHYGEITGDRELNFLKGTAIGSISELAPPYDHTLKSAAIISLITNTGEETASFYHGGPFFEIDSESEATVLARYQTIKNNPPAIVECSVGGGKALLCGVHPEMSSSELKIRILNIENSKLQTEYSDSLLKTLKTVELKRHKLWRMLLERCGLSLRV
jgi:glutamine amidotransferase-like uncharacterized protein